MSYDLKKLVNYQIVAGNTRLEAFHHVSQIIGEDLKALTADQLKEYMENDEKMAELSEHQKKLIQMIREEFKEADLKLSEQKDRENRYKMKALSTRHAVDVREEEEKFKAFVLFDLSNGHKT